MNSDLRIEALGTAHDRADFSCGVVALDHYLRALAGQDIKRRVSNCYVACGDGGKIAGFYTLAATSLPLPDIADADKQRLPRYAAMPAALIGRLAIDTGFQGRRLGGALILDAAQRAAKAEPAIFALIVDAKDDKAAGFYEHLGFRCFESRPGSLYLPIATALKALG